MLRTTFPMLRTLFPCCAPPSSPDIAYVLRAMLRACDEHVASLWRACCDHHPNIRCKAGGRLGGRSIFPRRTSNQEHYQFYYALYGCTQGLLILFCASNGCKGHFGPITDFIFPLNQEMHIILSKVSMSKYANLKSVHSKGSKE
jgi:hypothetical protein